jgi:hypothetical protein
MKKASVYKIGESIAVKIGAIVGPLFFFVILFGTVLPPCVFCGSVLDAVEVITVLVGGMSVGFVVGVLCGLFIWNFIYLLFIRKWSK